MYIFQMSPNKTKVSIPVINFGIRYKKDDPSIGRNAAADYKFRPFLINRAANPRAKKA